MVPAVPVSCHAAATWLISVPGPAGSAAVRIVPAVHPEEALYATTASVLSAFPTFPRRYRLSSSSATRANACMPAGYPNTVDVAPVSTSSISFTEHPDTDGVSSPSASRITHVPSDSWTCAPANRSRVDDVTVE